MRGMVGIAVGCAVVSFLCFLAPVLVMNPFTRQRRGLLTMTLRLHKAGPIVSAVCAVGAVVAAPMAWASSGSHGALGISLAVALLGASLTRLNVFEIVFRPYGAPDFVTADAIALDSEAMVMSFSTGGETHAYPVGAMGYHHIVNDMVGGSRVAATYCTVCHTGMVWNRELDDRSLTFRLAGIHDGNALLRDEQTESVWQQSTGEAIFGPLKGSRLQLMYSDELSYGLWRAENPRGSILKPVERLTWLYRNQGWEKFVEQFPAVMDTSKTGLDARELVFGVATASASKAFPARAVVSAGLIQDRAGDDAVLLLVGPDKLSVRAFHAPANTTFLRMSDTITDAETSSVWNFSGCATEGSRKGERLAPLSVVRQYWFDWQLYHPATEVFRS
jgi:hypothetical protein